MGKKIGRKSKGITPSQRLPQDSSKLQPHVKQINTPIRLSFQNFKCGGNFCLSGCQPNEIKNAMDCFRQITTLPWNKVLEQGGKDGKKVGLGFTPYKDSDLRKVIRPPEVSRDLTISAVRASGKFRVFGYYLDHVYYILWFDRNHDIVPAD